MKIFSEIKSNFYIVSTSSRWHCQWMVQIECYQMALWIQECPVPVPVSVAWGCHSRELSTDSSSMRQLKIFHTRICIEVLIYSACANGKKLLINLFKNIHKYTVSIATCPVKKCYLPSLLIDKLSTGDVLICVWCLPILRLMTIKSV